MNVHRRNARARGRRGATLVLVVLLLVVVVGLVAFAVDVGRMYLVRSQLQSAVDAGSLAAALKLKEDNQDIEGAVAAARQFVQLNRVGWLTTVPDDAITVTTGTWDPDTRVFTATNIAPNAVSVDSRLDDEPLFFAAVLGRREFSVPRGSIASAAGAKFDIMMVLDLSGSMGSHGRIQALRNAAPIFVDIFEQMGGDDQIGVMGYGARLSQYDPIEEGHSGWMYEETPQNLFPAYDDWVGVMEASLTDTLAELNQDVLTSETLLAGKYNDYTPIGAALRDAAHYLSLNGRDDENVEPVIVLMSDGHANRPYFGAASYARSMADYAASLGVTVYTVSLGNQADENLMDDIATRTGGKHFPANGVGEQQLTATLTAAFQHVAGSIRSTQLVQ